MRAWLERRDRGLVAVRRAARTALALAGAAIVAVGTLVSSSLVLAVLASGEQA